MLILTVGVSGIRIMMPNFPLQLCCFCPCSLLAAYLEHGLPFPGVIPYNHKYQVSFLLPSSPYLYMNTIFLHLLISLAIIVLSRPRGSFHGLGDTGQP